MTLRTISVSLGMKTMPKPRPSRSRKVPNKMHIYCEGEKTEPNYIQNYIDSLDDSALRKVVVIEPTKKNTPVQLVNTAVELKNSRSCPRGDIFWVVYDREAVGKYSDKLHDQAYNCAKTNNINIALTNVCFEQWILLHFINSDAAYTCYDDLINRSRLKSLFKKASGKDYDKGCGDIFNHLSENIGRARQRGKAINAKTLESAVAGKTKPYHLSPYTDMPSLLDAIDSFEH